MRKLKLGFALLLTLFIFSCENHDQLLDQTPVVTSPASTLGEPLGPTTTELIHKVMVKFPNQGIDKTDFRNKFTTALGISSWTTCTSDPDSEIWVISGMTEANLDAAINTVILGDLNLFPKSTQDDSASHGVKVKTGDPFAKQSEFIVLFFYTNQCQ